MSLPFGTPTLFFSNYFLSFHFFVISPPTLLSHSLSFLPLFISSLFFHLAALPLPLTDLLTKQHYQNNESCFSIVLLITLTNWHFNYLLNFYGSFSPLRKSFAITSTRKDRKIVWIIFLTAWNYSKCFSSWSLTENMGHKRFMNSKDHRINHMNQIKWPNQQLAYMVCHGK